MRREKNVYDITDTEWCVMQALWEGTSEQAEQGMTLGQLAEHLRTKEWTKPTIRTLLMRLEEKQAVTVDRSRGVFRYIPNFSREEHLQDQVQRFVERVFDGSVTELLAILRQMEIEE